jgi:predicted transcriptional regulator/DNA-binding XRE family transcriptional regulator
LEAGKEPALGAKVKALRRREGITQAHLAQVLEISPSYLNLIESNRRPLTAPLLIRLARHFSLDLQAFAPGDDAGTASALAEALTDPVFGEHPLGEAEAQEAARQSPALARATLTLYRAWRSQREAQASSAEGDAEEVPEERRASEEVSALIQAQGNHFPALEEAAEALWGKARLRAEGLQRALAQALEEAHGVKVEVIRGGADPAVTRRDDPRRRVLELSEALAPHSQTFQLARQLGLLSCGDVLEELVKASALTTPGSRALARAALANYVAAAVVMPYARFLEAAQGERYDIERLGRRFQASFEQVCHRLTSLRRPGAEGIPFHMVRVDAAGNISKRFSASGLAIARFGEVCPRWGLFAAFQTPGMIRVQRSQMTDGRHYFCVSRTLDRRHGGHSSPRASQALSIGCGLEHARALVYADHLDLARPEAAVPIGVTCRRCERRGCAERAFSPAGGLQVEEELPGRAFSAGADSP